MMLLDIPTGQADTSKVIKHWAHEIQEEISILEMAFFHSYPIG